MEIYKKSQILSSLNDEQKLIHQSKHLLLELYRCDREKLNDESFLRCILSRASKLANATVLNLISNKFEPQGLRQLHYWQNLIFQYILGLNLIIRQSIFLLVVKI